MPCQASEIYFMYYCNDFTAGKQHQTILVFERHLIYCCTQIHWGPWYLVLLIRDNAFQVKSRAAAASVQDVWWFPSVSAAVFERKYASKLLSR